MYVATVNTPGYLPDTDQPASTFDTPQQAWSYLCDQRTEAEDSYLGESYSETRETLAQLGSIHTWHFGCTLVPASDDVHMDRGPRDQTALCGAWSWSTVTNESDEVSCPQCLDRIEVLSHLASLGVTTHGVGSVYGPSVSERMHDLGVVYTVTKVDHVSYPHIPGYLHDCPACEARCHCEPDSSECVFEGEHNA